MNCVSFLKKIELLERERERERDAHKQETFNIQSQLKETSKCLIPTESDFQEFTNKKICSYTWYTIRGVNNTRLNKLKYLEFLIYKL